MVDRTLKRLLRPKRLLEVGKSLSFRLFVSDYRLHRVHVRAQQLRRRFSFPGGKNERDRSRSRERINAINDLCCLHV